MEQQRIDQERSKLRPHSQILAHAMPLQSKASCQLDFHPPRQYPEYRCTGHHITKHPQPAFIAVKAA